MFFRNRTEAGQMLSNGLKAYRDRDDVVVLALPRGGVPVGFEIAQSLNAPLDVFLVRKLGVPGYEELAMGAIATGGVLVRNQSVTRQIRISDEHINQIAAEEQRELQRRERAYRDDLPLPELAGRIAILVDDGLATGSTMYAAMEAVRQQHPDRIVIAVPVAPQSLCKHLRNEVDEVVCVLEPEDMGAIGGWYQNFSQTSDTEVCQLLEKASGHSSVAHP
jgi:putative phosphoribosyl transferase